MATTSAVRVLGIREVNGLLGKLDGAGRAIAGLRVRVISRLPYAYGIRTGRHRGGSVARRAGGTKAIDNAKDAVVPEIAPALAAALPQGTEAATKVILAAAERIRERVAGTEAEQSGDLRRSYRVERG